MFVQTKERRDLAKINCTCAFLSKRKKEETSRMVRTDILRGFVLTLCCQPSGLLFSVQKISSYPNSLDHFRFTWYGVIWRCVIAHIHIGAPSRSTKAIVSLSTSWHLGRIVVSRNPPPCPVSVLHAILAIKTVSFFPSKSSGAKTLWDPYIYATHSLLRRGLFVLWGGWVGRLGRKKKISTEHYARQPQVRPFRSFLICFDAIKFVLPSPPRAFNFFDYCYYIGIPSVSICGGESVTHMTELISIVYL